MKDDLSRYLRLAEGQDIVITRHGRPAGLLIGFQSEEDWFEYQLEHNPEFLARIAQARSELREDRGIRLEDITSSRRSNKRMQLTRSATANSRRGPRS